MPTIHLFLRFLIFFLMTVICGSCHQYGKTYFSQLSFLVFSFSLTIASGAVILSCLSLFPPSLINRYLTMASLKHEAEPIRLNRLDKLILSSKAVSAILVMSSCFLRGESCCLHMFFPSADFSDTMITYLQTSV